MESTDKPVHHISKKAIKVWRFSNVLTSIVAFIMIAGLWLAGTYFHWPEWVMTMTWVLFGCMLLLAVWAIFFYPHFKYKYWRYGIDAAYIRLKSGVFKRSYAIIPMTKVQYVSATQGPILRKYGLYTIEIGSMASSHDIPALSKEEAFLLRDQIAHLAKIKEVDN